MMSEPTATAEPGSRLGQRWPVFLLGLIGFAAIAIILVYFLRPGEPMFQGQPLTFWCHQARQPEGDRPGALRAARAAGQEGVPFLLRELRQQDSVVQRLRRRTWNWLPSAVQNRVARPRPKDDHLFYWISEMLAQCAAEPQLFKALQDSNTDVRLAATWALTRMASGHGQGSETAAGRVALLLKDPVADVRVSAALALGAMSSNRVEIVSVLIQGLNDSSLRESVASNLKFAASYTLARLGTNAHAAVPELRKLLNHPVAGCSVPAAIALWRIARDTNAVSQLVTELDVATKNKRPEDAWVCYTVLNALVELGPEAEAAKPLVVNLIEFPRRSWPRFYRTNILEKARLALKSIDPELERKTKTYSP